MSGKAKNIAVPGISASALRVIEEAVEQGFFVLARELLKDPAWSMGADSAVGLKL
jgi:hypothetical protein